MHGAKQCSICRDVKGRDEFHLKGVDGCGKPKLQSSCKKCANAKRMDRYQKKKIKKPKKRHAKHCVTDFEVEIVYDPGCNHASIMKDVMIDYIEAVYACSV